MNLKDEDILNLPDAPDFVSEEPKYTWEQMARLSERMLPVWNSQPRQESELEGIREPFTLD